ncbi:MAG: carboxyl transferase domain-containing protein [Caldilineaceae bacterium]
MGRSAHGPAGDDPLRQPWNRHHRPDNPNKPYDMHEVIQYIVDDAQFIEVHERPGHRISSSALLARAVFLSAS